MNADASPYVSRSRTAATFLASLLAVGGCARWGFERLGIGENIDPESGIVPSTATCSDGLRNGDESGVDCGGSACEPCATNATCDSDAGCAEGACVQGTCLALVCIAATQGAGETTTGCGGPCGPSCDAGRVCAPGDDCAVSACDAGGCASCQDGVQNQDETDTDCGGGACAPCPNDAGCLAATDCESGVCGGSVCQVPTCSDAVLNQNETNTDCGGVCGATCSVLQAALVHRYRFDGTGTTITDSVGNADGVLVNTVLSGSGSVSLAGGSSAQYVDLPNGIVSILVDATFEAWLTWNGGQGWQKIFDFGTSSAGEGNQSSFGQRFLSMSPKRALLDEAFLMRHCPETDCSNAGQWIEAAAADTLAAGEIKHVVGVFDDTGSEMRIYVDGAPVGSQVNGRALSELNDVNNWLGRSQYVGDPDFDGQLHEFRIYAQALSDGQVQASYEAGPDPGFL